MLRQLFALVFVYCLLLARQASAQKQREVVWEREVITSLTDNEGRTVDGPSNCTSLAFSPNGEFLAVGGSRGDIHLLRAADGTPVRSMQNHSFLISSLAFTPDSSLLLTSTSHTGEDIIRVWRVADGKQIRYLEGHTNFVNKLALSPDGALLASGGEDYRVKLWRVSDWQAVRTLQANNRIEDVAFSPDGKWIAGCGWVSGGHRSGPVYIWRASDGKLVTSLKVGTDYVQTVSFSPDGKYLAASGKSCRLWRAVDWKPLPALQNTEAYPLCFSPDSKSLICINGNSKQVLQWRNVPKGDLSVKYSVGEMELNRNTIAFSADGRLFAYINYNGEKCKVVLMKPPTGQTK